MKHGNLMKNLPMIVIIAILLVACTWKTISNSRLRYIYADRLRVACPWKTKSNSRVGAGSQNAPQESVESNLEKNWPNFLREWAADYEIDDPRRLDVINLIDTVYRLADDSTADRKLLCNKMCQLKDELVDVITHDPSRMFSLMMRATARNLSGKLIDNPWLMKMDCSCELMDYPLIETYWYTSSKEGFDIMHYNFLPRSWQAPYRFAGIALTKEDGNELTPAALLVFNWMDTTINNLQLTFKDENGAVVERFTEKDVYVDSSNVDGGAKMMLLPIDLLMRALAVKGVVSVTYETANETVEMIGFPNLFFAEQIENCPRLKRIFKEITQ